MTTATDLRAQLQNLFGARGFGRALTVTRTTPGAYDPATGATGAPSTTTIPGIGRVGEYSDYATNGTLVLAGDRRCTFVPTDPAAVVQTGDTLTDGANIYRVIRVKTRELGTLIAYTLQVRA